MFERQTRTANSSDSPLPESLTMWPELLARALENRSQRPQAAHAREFIRWTGTGRTGWVMTIRDDNPACRWSNPVVPAAFFRVDDARNARPGHWSRLSPSPPRRSASWGTIRASSNQPTGLVITIRLPIA